MDIIIRSKASYFRSLERKFLKIISFCFDKFYERHNHSQIYENYGYQV
jgi:hypothetical protein